MLTVLTAFLGSIVIFSSALAVSALFTLKG